MSLASLPAKDVDCNCEKNYCPTIIKCGCSGGTLTVSTTLTVLSTIEVNIPKKCNSCTLIQYAVTGIAPTDTNRAFLVRVFKNCGNGYRVQVGPALNFNVGDKTNTLSGFVCDCDNCCEYECCNYTIEAQTVTEGHTITGSATASAIVGNSSCHC